MNIKFFRLLIFIFLGACQSSPPPLPNPIINVDTPAETIKLDGQPSLVLVTGSLAIIRNRPDVSAAEIARYKKNDTLLFVNELSRHTLEIKLDDIVYDEPWLKVALPNQNGLEGWVFAGSLRFLQTPSLDLQSLTMARRIDKILGAGWNDKLQAYNQEFNEMQTDIAFQMVWQRAEQIKVDLEQKINELYNQSVSSQKNDFAWINDVFNGYQLYWLDEKQQFALYKNLSSWLPKTIQTADTSDEYFLNNYLLLYANDSSEFWYTDLNIRKSANDTLLYSLLGRNIHSQILAQTTNYSQDNLFKSHYADLRQIVINDILLCDRFWLDIETVKKELKTILNAPDYNLNKNNRISLEARLAVLENYQANGIIVNGIEN